MMKRVKVTVPLIMEIDPEAWDLTYGTGTKVADIREDVREYIVNAVMNTGAAHEGAVVSAVLRP